MHISQFQCIISSSIPQVQANLRQSPGLASGQDGCNVSVIPPAPLFFRHLQMSPSNTLNSNFQCYEAQIPLTQPCKEEVRWWNTHMIRCNGKSLFKKEADTIIDSDASLIGWGATCQNQRNGGPWSQSECSMHSNCQELLAVTLTVHTILKNKTKMSVLLRVDNTTVST